MKIYFLFLDCGLEKNKNLKYFVNLNSGNIVVLKNFSYLDAVCISLEEILTHLIIIVSFQEMVTEPRVETCIILLFQ